MTRSDESPQAGAYLITNPAEDGEPFGFIAGGDCWIIKAPVNHLCARGEDGTGCSRVITDGDHIVELLTGEFVHRLRAVCRDVNPDSRIAATASGRTEPGRVPALKTANFSPPSCRNNPSAIWLRAELPAHKINTRFCSVILELPARDCPLIQRC